MRGAFLKRNFTFWLFHLFIGRVFLWGFTHWTFKRFFLFYDTLKVLPGNFVHLLKTLMKVFSSGLLALFLFAWVLNELVLAFKNLIQLFNIRVRFENMTVSICFRKWFDPSFEFMFFIGTIKWAVFSNWLVYNGILLLERFLSNCIDLLQFFLFDVVLLIALYDVVYVGYCVLNDPGHDINRTQVIHLWTFVHLGFLWISVLFHYFKIAQIERLLSHWFAGFVLDYRVLFDRILIGKCFKIRVYKTSFSGHGKVTHGAVDRNLVKLVLEDVLFDRKNHPYVF